MPGRLIDIVLIMATSLFYSLLYKPSNQGVFSASSVQRALALHTASNSWALPAAVLPSDADQHPCRLLIGRMVTAAIWLLARHDASPTFSGKPT